MAIGNYIPPTVNLDGIVVILERRGAIPWVIALRAVPGRERRKGHEAHLNPPTFDQTWLGDGTNRPEFHQHWPGVGPISATKRGGTMIILEH